MRGAEPRRQHVIAFIAMNNAVRFRGAQFCTASFNIDTGRPFGRPVLGFGHPVHLFRYWATRGPVS